MSIRNKIRQSLPALREALLSAIEENAPVLEQAHGANPWFVPSFSMRAIRAIADRFLDEERYRSWSDTYREATTPRTIGLIMAGNLPLVGFHDLFCVLSAGHHAQVKCSDKDAVLLPWLTNVWSGILPEIGESIKYTERLAGFDAAIATGSNNSARYFEYYFRDYPHVLRQNRNGVAVLTGQESTEELKRLAEDIFLYYGMGCRSVSKLYVPEGYDFGIWDEVVADWKYLEDHHKYKNNLEYNYAIFIINRIPHINLGCLILKEDEAIPSRIGCVHYSFYTDDESLTSELDRCRQEIQCVVSREPVRGWEHVSFGQSQWPALDQYADGVDTMQFLQSL